MRQISREARDAFQYGRNFKKSNTEVIVSDKHISLSLHGNIIAYKFHDVTRSIYITNCGWFSRTTKERLNALPNVHIHQVDGLWYLDGKYWSGELIKI